jgi:hypothetical protein
MHKAPWGSFLNAVKQDMCWCTLFYKLLEPERALQVPFKPVFDFDR